jgi:hypothetical protein
MRGRVIVAGVLIGAFLGWCIGYGSFDELSTGAGTLFVVGGVVVCLAVFYVIDDPDADGDTIEIHADGDGPVVQVEDDEEE